MIVKSITIKGTKHQTEVMPLEELEQYLAKLYGDREYAFFATLAFDSNKEIVEIYSRAVKRKSLSNSNTGVDKKRKKYYKSRLSKIGRRMREDGFDTAPSY